MNKIHEKLNQIFYYNQITMNTILLMPENLINFGKVKIYKILTHYNIHVISRN